MNTKLIEKKTNIRHMLFVLIT